MVEKNRSLRSLLHEFAEGSTAHGVGRIASSESAIWRLFWILVTLAGGGMVIYQGILLINTYKSKPIKSNIDITYKRPIIFPAVTVCNLNNIKKSFLHKFPDADSIASSFNSSVIRSDQGPHPKNLTSHLPDEQIKKVMMNFLKTDASSNAEETSTLENVTMDRETYTQRLILTKLAKYKQAELEKGGHHFHELVFRCAFQTFSCQDGDFLKYWKLTWNWRYGNCFTFNSGFTRHGKKTPVLKTTKPGPQYGLTLDLFVNQNEYVPILSQEAGVRVLITEKRKIPFPVDEGFSISPGFVTSIALRKLNVIRVDPFHNGSCHEKESLEDFSVYHQFSGSSYSVQGCMYSCFARAQVASCNCTEAKFRFGERICSASAEEMRCIQDLQKRYESDELGCSAKCPQPCNHISYRTSMSSSSWSISYEKQLQSMMLKEGGSDLEDMGKSTERLRENFLRIKIYFEELNVERITYSNYYELENLMSDIGGQLGLWIGVSVITVAEVFKLFLDVIKLLCRKAYSTEGKVQDISMSNMI